MARSVRGIEHLRNEASSVDLDRLEVVRLGQGVETTERLTPDGIDVLQSPCIDPTFLHPIHVRHDGECKLMNTHVHLGIWRGG